MAQKKPTYIHLSSKTNNKFSKHVTKNLQQCRFVNDTPFVIRSGFRLVAVKDIDVRDKSDKEVKKVLEKLQSTFGEIVTLKVLDPSGSNFETLKLKSLEEVRIITFAICCLLVVR